MTEEMKEVENRPEVLVKISSRGFSELKKLMPKTFSSLYYSWEEDIKKLIGKDFNVSVIEHQGYYQNTIVEISCAKEEDLRNISNGKQFSLLEEFRQKIKKAYPGAKIFTFHFASPVFCKRLQKPED